MRTGMHTTRLCRLYIESCKPRLASHILENSHLRLLRRSVFIATKKKIAKIKLSHKRNEQRIVNRNNQRNEYIFR